ncbi:MAG: hypothetical protein Q9220_002190 [cf. Caloplaca sp. 1 TL-2023]
MNSTIPGRSFSPIEPTLYPRPPLLSSISDNTLSVIVPVIVHWLTAAFYEVSQYYGFFQRYKIHTSEEERAKNTVSKSECLRGVLTVQVMQSALGVFLGMISEVEMTGSEDRDVLAWVDRLQLLGRFILTLSTYCGLDVAALTTVLSKSDLVTTSLARFDAGTFHARHHEIYVPYSWGGIYDHPIESLFLSVGAFVVAVMGTGMSLRESMIFSAFSSAKTCTDHSGYKFPWNPVDLFTSVDAEYHDKHHQRWGFKHNFALHFQFWDRLLGTEFTDAQAASKFYERDRKAAEILVAGKINRVKPR